MKLITKVICLIVILMSPVIALYAYSNAQSTRLVEEQLTIANRQRLAIFMHQIEAAMEQVSQYSNLISQEPDFAQFAGNVIPANGYDYAMLSDALQRKLSLFSTSTAWMNRINVYFPGSGHAVSSYSLLPYNIDYLLEQATTRWTYRTIRVDGAEKRAFTRFFIEPASAASDIRKADVVVEIDLMADNIERLLDSFKTKGNNDPFLYKGAGELVLNGSADEPTIRRLIEQEGSQIADSAGGYRSVSLDGRRYLVYGLVSPKIGWTLVDYVPLETILAPVTSSRNLFYVTACLLVLMGAGAAYLIYSQVQRPIRQLGEGTVRLERGDLAARLPSGTNRDFAGLFRQFNRMAEQQQHLIEKVYREQLRAKEAVMKQLQSQINPHFLYNSFAYIVSMAQMNRLEPVVSMAYSLSDYYRYSTRNERLDTTVKEEVAFVRSYMDIMNMQLRKIGYTIDMAPELESLVIPRLLLQPIVENAIIHGLEPKKGGGSIAITGRAADGTVCFTVEDDGVGLADEALERLNLSLKETEPPGDDCGLWNVHQRLEHRFGLDAGLLLTRSESGGVKVTLSWPDVSYL
ncbi:sensor histidine kinase [Paenibacillus ginsengarvi]|uniref:Sensor histidine kinase n=1 Tax=Paenibacillus ginsengarvi TaxID=400777 RepID=A0A3B0BAX8_9BACL|nr:histidine kinase [Paenibacillus ginsengarvi]RKN70595.1 sensor histidine kinase [Paenibacillus ginsengarvi]